MALVRASYRIACSQEYGLIKQDTLSHIMDPFILEPLFLNQAILGSLGFWFIGFLRVSVIHWGSQCHASGVDGRSSSATRTTACLRTGWTSGRFLGAQTPACTYSKAPLHIWPWNKHVGSLCSCGVLAASLRKSASYTASSETRA